MVGKNWESPKSISRSCRQLKMKVSQIICRSVDRTSLLFYLYTVHWAYLVWLSTEQCRKEYFYKIKKIKRFVPQLYTPSPHLAVINTRDKKDRYICEPVLGFQHSDEGGCCWMLGNILYTALLLFWRPLGGNVPLHSSSNFHPLFSLAPSLPFPPSRLFPPPTPHPHLLPPSLCLPPTSYLVNLSPDWHSSPNQRIQQ